MALCFLRDFFPIRVSSGFPAAESGVMMWWWWYCGVEWSGVGVVWAGGGWVVWAGGGWVEWSEVRRGVEW
jgi:hypothetical protein